MSQKNLPPTHLKVITSQTSMAQPIRVDGSVPFDMGSEAGQVMIQLNCVNLPVGTIIGFDCSEPGPNPPIYLPPTKVTTSKFGAGIMTNVPANFSGIINYYAVFDQTPPANATITLELYLIINA